MGLQELMTGIAQIEGFNTPGTIAQRNNNPGNLRYASNQIGSEKTVNGTFATFATEQDGWNALQDYITNKANNGVSLKDFIYTYAPPTENNTSNYLNYISGQLGVNQDTSLGEVINGQSSLSSSGDSFNSTNYNDVPTEGIGLVGIGLGVLILVLLISEG